MRYITVLLAFSLMVFSVVVSTSAMARDDDMTTAQLYQKYCATCHGDNGDAQTRARAGMDPKPRDFTTAEASMELTRQRMINSVTNGRPGTAMMAHKNVLSKTQIASLVDYIRGRFMRVPTADKGKEPQTVSAGEKIYGKNCAVCHGDKGNIAYWAKNGLNPPPRDFTGPRAQSELTRERMIRSITYGRPGTGMMPFSTRLTKEQIAEVVRFIRFKFMGLSPDKDTGETPLVQLKPANTASSDQTATTPHTPHVGGIPGIDTPLSSANAPTQKAPATTEPAAANPHASTQTSTSSVSSPKAGMPSVMTPGMPGGHAINVDMTAPIPNHLKPDVNWGRKFYMNNCFNCHGVKGNGKGPRAFFNVPKPRDFTSEASRQVLNRPRVFNSITNGRVGSVMPAWGKVLNQQQIADLTEFVFEAFIQGKGANNVGNDKDGKDTDGKTGKSSANDKGNAQNSDKKKAG